MPHRLVDEARDPEVDHLQPAGIVEEHVGRLHVAVDDTARVRRIEGCGRLLQP
jgi:hypothetical protein